MFNLKKLVEQPPINKGEKEKEGRMEDRQKEKKEDKKEDHKEDHQENRGALAPLSTPSRMPILQRMLLREGAPSPSPPPALISFPELSPSPPPLLSPMSRGSPEPSLAMAPLDPNGIIPGDVVQYLHQCGGSQEHVAKAAQELRQPSTLQSMLAIGQAIRASRPIPPEVWAAIGRGTVERGRGAPQRLLPTELDSEREEREAREDMSRFGWDNWQPSSSYVAPAYEYKGFFVAPDVLKEPNEDSYEAMEDAEHQDYGEDDK